MACKRLWLCRDKSEMSVYIVFAGRAPTLDERGAWQQTTGAPVFWPREGMCQRGFHSTFQTALHLPPGGGPVEIEVRPKPKGEKR